MVLLDTTRPSGLISAIRSAQVTFHLIGANRERLDPAARWPRADGSEEFYDVPYGPVTLAFHRQEVSSTSFCKQRTTPRRAVALLNLFASSIYKKTLLPLRLWRSLFGFPFRQSVVLHPSRNEFLWC